MLRADTPRDGVERRAADRGGQSEREEKYVSVFPHWWYIRCKIRRVTTRAHRAVYADAPCKLSRTVSSGTARYVIRPRTPNSLHGGALPVVVLFAPALPVYAACCISMREAVPPSPSDDVDLSSSSSFFSSLIFYSSSSFFLFGGTSRSLFRLAFFRRAELRVETGERESLQTRKLRYLGLKSIPTLSCDARFRLVVLVLGTPLIARRLGTSLFLVDLSRRNV